MDLKIHFRFLNKQRAREKTLNYIKSHGFYGCVWMQNKNIWNARVWSNEIKWEKSHSLIKKKQEKLEKMRKFSLHIGLHYSTQWLLLGFFARVITFQACKTQSRFIVFTFFFRKWFTSVFFGWFMTIGNFCFRQNYGTDFSLTQSIRAYQQRFSWIEKVET